jgi:hypothetical protein
LGGFVKIESARVEDLLQRHLAHHHRDDFRLGIEALENGREFVARLAADEVDLADQQYVGELDLFDQQVGDRAFIFLAQGLAADARLSAA